VPAEFRPKAILDALNKRHVDFVVIGGLAAIAHGSVLPSFDLDIAYARDRANLERLVGVLLEVGATLRGAPANLSFKLDAKTLENGSHFTFETRYGSFDLLSDPAGAPAYPQLKSAAVATEIDGEHVLIASLDHLIAMKEATGREKDKYMAREYRTLADEIRKREPAVARDQHNV
jgi:hypothetical protein